MVAGNHKQGFGRTPSRFPNIFQPSLGTRKFICTSVVSNVARDEDSVEICPLLLAEIGHQCFTNLHVAIELRVSICCGDVQVGKM